MHLLLYLPIVKGSAHSTGVINYSSALNDLKINDVTENLWMNAKIRIFL